MIYRWAAPKDLGIEADTVFRLKLTTDTPATTHLSGKLRFANTNAESSSSTPLYTSEKAGLAASHVAGMALVATLAFLCVRWITVRLRRRSRRIVLE